MKIIEKKVYYCDYCKKHGLSSGAMKSHELKCLFNPKRYCATPYCQGIIGTDIEALKIVEDNLIYQYNEKNYAEVSDEIVNQLLDRNECPVCTLAILIAVNRKLKDTTYVSWNWDYKKAQAEYYKDYNEENNPYCRS